MPLRREQVVEAALELLDEVGLDAFTTRALTDRLGVQRGALYWHVKSKQELLAAVTALVLRPVFADSEPDHDTDWADDLVEYAHRLRDAMLAHRDGARLVAAHVTVNNSGVEQMARSLERFTRQGIPTPVAARWGDIVSSYVTGYVLQEQTAPAADPAAATFEPWFPDGHPSSAETFADSVATIVLGMRAEAASLAVGR
jgi:TetR/AcrR family tetracycline transcriptional repressor